MYYDMCRSVFFLRQPRGGVVSVTRDRPPLSNLVRDYVQQHILENDLRAGDPLPTEAQLAEEIGVGRSSVREATKLLQSLGIVEIRQGFGLFVGPFTFDPIIDAFGYGMRIDATTLSELAQVRYYLESAAIKDAVAQIDAAQIGRLEELMESWRQRRERGEPDIDLDEQFHYLLYSTLNNRALLKLFQGFWLAFSNLKDDPIINEPKPLWEDYKDHLSILEAVKARDVTLAQQRLMLHFRHLQERIRRATAQEQN
jgi:DNA-binding FadR family transcriptional regulator